MAVRFLLDENLPESLVQALAQCFPKALHVRTLGLAGATDLLLWHRAIAESCVLVTKDEDFVKLSVLRGPPPKVVWLNVGNAGTGAIADLLLQHAEAIEGFEAHPDSGFLALRFGPGAG